MAEEGYTADANIFAKFAEAILNRLIDIIMVMFPDAKYEVNNPSFPFNHRIIVYPYAEPTADQLGTLYAKLSEQVLFLLRRDHIEVGSSAIEALKERLLWSVSFSQLGKRTAIAFLMDKTTDWAVHISVFRS